MSKPIQQKMHEQHRKWRRDHETWQADIDEWRKELKAALADIAEVETTLRNSLDAIHDRADAIWEDEQRVRAHERVIGAEAMAGAHKTDREWAAVHRRQAAAHERAAAAHARIKKYQRTVVAEVTRLVNLARRAM